MRPAPSVIRSLCGHGSTPSTPTSLRRLRTQRSLFLLKATSPTATHVSLPQHHPSRCLSQQAGRWLDKLRYGAEDAPSLGSWGNAYEDNALDTRKLYCKALVHASGGSRLARDWIAGCAALTSPDPSLIYTALQHAATEADVEELREHFLQRLLARDEEQRGHQHRRDGVSEDDKAAVGGNGASTGWQRRQPRADADSDIASFAVAEEEGEMEREVLLEDEEAPAPSSSSSSATAFATDESAAAAAAAVGTAGRAGAATAQGKVDDDGGDDDGDDDISPDSVRAAEQLLLSRSPEVRCFMYDAMTASLFHSNYDLRTVEAARRRTFWIGVNVFGISSDELTLLWRVVEAELLLKKEKIKVLGQPWSE